MLYADALKIAEGVLAQMRPHCHRAEIAGSVRRKKPEVKDIEIVAYPMPYENDGMFVSGVAEVFNQWREVKTGDKYTQRVLPSGIKLDLFFADEINFGWIMALRTGSSEFNFKYLEALKNHYMYSKGGYIRNDKRVIPVPTEQDFFNLIKMPFIKPEDRI